MKNHKFTQLTEHDIQEVDALRIHFNKVTGKEFSKEDIIEIAIRAMKEKINQSGIEYLFESGLIDMKK